MHGVATKRDLRVLTSGRPYGLDILAVLSKHRLAMIGLGIVLSLILIALLAPLLTPHDPIEQNLKERLASPCWEYPFGTDDLGRCILSRIMFATRVSLQVGVVVVGITATFGTLIGLLAGYRGGFIDEIIMRLVDVFMAFPGIILALVIAGLLGPGLFNVMLALSIVGWTSYARVVRGCVLSAKERTFIEASRAIGGGSFYIMFRHILPAVVAPVIVMATLGMGWTILSAAALSFLGLGSQPPTAEWGAMLNNGRTYLQTAWHLSTFPGLMIMITVLAFNFLGDGLRDAMDTRLRAEAEI